MKARLIAVLSLSLLASGCTDDPTIVASPGGPQTGCTTTRQCPDELACIEGACLGEAAPTARVHLRIHPDPAGRSAAVELRDLEFTTGPILEAPLPVTLPDRLDLVGRAVTTDTPPRVVAVLAVARPAGSSIGEAGRLLAGAIDTPNGPRFTLPLAACFPDLNGTCKTTKYGLRLIPAPGLLPPADFDDVEFSGSGDIERSFALPGASVPSSLHGVVTYDGRGVLAGFVVGGFDDTDRRVTTEAETDFEGRFELRFWPQWAGQAVTLRVRSAHAERPFPTVKQSLRLPLPPSGDERPLGTSRERPLVMDVPAIEASVVFNGRVTDERVGVAGVHVRVANETPIGRHVSETRSGLDGVFQLTTFPGSLTIDVVPPLGTPYRVSRIKLDGGSQPLAAAHADPTVILLEPRLPVSGRVVDAAGRGVFDARVVAQLRRRRFPVPSLEPKDDLPPTRVLETQTSPDGDFTLLLDPGDHELRVSPPVGSGAPEVIVLVPVPALDDVAIHMGTVTLPPAALILFELRDAAGLPVVGARVSAYFGATDEVPNPPVIAESLSDTSGRVRVRIPVASLVD